MIHHVLHAHRARVHAAVQDGVIQPGIDIGVIAHRFLLAGFGELLVGRPAELAAIVTHLFHPVFKVRLRFQAVEMEAHVGETGAAVVGGETVVHAGLVDHAVQLGLHARHGIDLPGQRGDVERVHVRVRGDLEADRPVHRRRQFVDGGDALLRIEEQPFPLQRHHLHHQRLGAFGHRAAGVDAVQRTIRVQLMGAHPGDGAQRDDDQQRHRPDHQLEHGRVIPVRRILRVPVGSAIPPGEHQRHDDHRHDHDQHQTGGPENQITLLHGDIAGGRHHHHVTARQQGQGNG